MSKKKIHYISIINGNKSEFNHIGEYDEEKGIITYKESHGILYNFTIDIKNKILIDDCHEYTITFDFNKSSYDVLLKENNGVDTMPIEVKKFEFNGKKLTMEYIDCVGSHFIEEIEVGD